MRAVRIRRGMAIVGVTVGLLGIGACGGDDSESDSEAAAVGDCIDADNQVVDCEAAEAAMTLTSDQSAPDAIACVEISEPPEVEVTVGDKTFCAQEK